MNETPNRHRLGDFKFTWVTIVFIVLASLGLWATVPNLASGELWSVSDIPMSLWRMGMGLAAFGIVDNILLRRFSTYEMLRNSPTAYAIYCLGAAFIIGCAIMPGL